MSFRRGLIFTAALLLLSVPSFAQNNTEQVDSLVSLLSAQSMELIEKSDGTYRKVTGPARFFHNNTFLLCDTALWNVNKAVIEAYGNVKILQSTTVLTSDELTYLIDEDLAQFRGTLVQLEDVDRNTLRTKHLDYNTKDSVAVFRNGGSLKDKDGQIIESRNGTYDSKIKTFTFTDNVNMFTDSIFVKTTRIEYMSDAGYAKFGRRTDAWKDENMLSADDGWYDRPSETFFFTDNVHILTDTQEAWSDSLYFHRRTTDVEMTGNVQVTDTSRNASALAGRMEYVDSISQVTMTRMPAVIGITDTTRTAKDTVYLGGDILRMRTYRMCDIDSLEIANASTRRSDINSDAVGAYRKSAYEEALKAAEDAKNKNEDYKIEQEAKAKREALAQKSSEKDSAGSGSSAETPAGAGPGGGSSGGGPGDGPGGGPGGASARGGSRGDVSVGGGPRGDSSAGGGLRGDISAAEGLKLPPDSVFVASADSLRIAGDSLLVAKDSLLATGDSLMVVRDSLLAAGDSLLVARDSLLAAGDSLLVAGDSLLVQADSLAMVPKDTTKVTFLGAFGNVRLYREDLQMKCDTLLFNELDSLARLHVEPIVWNDGNRQYAADSMYVSFGNNNLDKAYLMSNAFVTVEEAPECYDQIRSTEMLAFFNEKGALSRFDALGSADAVFYLKEDSTYATVNKSQSKLLSATFTDGELDTVSYFQEAKSDAYPLAQMTNDDRVLKGFNWKPELCPSGPESVTTRKLRETQRRAYEARPRAQFKQTEIYFPGYMSGVYKEIEENELRARERRNSNYADSTGVPSEALSDSLGLGQAVPADSLSFAADSLSHLSPADSLSAVSDSLATSVDSLAAVQLSEKEMLRAQRQAQRLAKLEARNEKWARLDSLDAAKAAAKLEKKAEKERQNKLKLIEQRVRQENKEAARLEKYRLKYEKRLKKKQAKDS